MHTRDALLPDAERIHELISEYSTDGTLLPRTLAEICENVRDFTVLEEADKVIGCGALHLYGPHLAEIRSITVDRDYQKRAAAVRHPAAGGELSGQAPDMNSSGSIFLPKGFKFSSAMAGIKASGKP